MTDTLATSDPLLCGTPLGDLVAQVAEGRPSGDPSHQAGCPYCTATLDRIESWWTAVGTAVAEPLTTPPRAQERVRDWFANLASVDWVVLLRAEPGRTVVSTVALAGVAAAAAESIGEVAGVRRCTAAIAGPTVTIDIDLVARFGAELRPLAQRTRMAVMADVATLAACPVAAVDVHIIDLVGRPTTPRR